MKIRNGFVSNSSSSSFVCQICNEEVIGRDICMYYDAEMVECKNGHIFCMSHINEKFSEELEKIRDEDQEDYNEDWEYEIPEKMCPLCQLEIINDDTILSYVLKKHKFEKEELKKEIKEKFGTYSNYIDYLKGK